MSSAAAGSRKRLLGQAAEYLVALAVPAGFGLLGTYLFTRLFPPGEYGHLTLALAIAGPAATIFSQWLAQPVERYYAEYERAGQLDLFFAVVRGALSRVLMAIVTGGLVLLVIRAVVLRSTSNEALITGAIAVVCTQVAFTALLPILRASFRASAFRSYQVATAALSVGFALLLLALTSRDVACVLWGQALAQAVLLPSLLRRTGLLSHGASVARAEIEAVLDRFKAYGVPMTIWFVSAAVLAVEDRFVIELTRGTTEQAVFSANYNLIAGIASLANTPVNLVAGPLLFAAWARRQRNVVQDLITRMTELYGILAIALVGGVVVVGDAFVRLVLDEAYHEGAVILLPVVLGIVAWGATNIGRKGLELHGRTATLAWGAGAAALLNLVLNIILVPRFGILAAAYTTAVSYVAYTVGIHVLSRRVMEWRVPWAALLAYVLAGGLSAVVGMAVTAAVGRHGALFELLFGGIAFLAAYVTTLWIASGSRLRRLLSTV